MKAESALVQFHFVHGNRNLVNNALGSIVDNILRVSQRMRLEASQLEAVSTKVRVSDVTRSCSTSPSVLELSAFYLCFFILERKRTLYVVGGSARTGPSRFGTSDETAAEWFHPVSAAEAGGRHRQRSCNRLQGLYQSCMLFTT